MLVAGHNVEVVESFTYLGVNIDNTGSTVLPSNWRGIKQCCSPSDFLSHAPSSTRAQKDAEMSDWVKLHAECLFTPRKPVVTRGGSF